MVSPVVSALGAIAAPIVSGLFGKSSPPPVNIPPPPAPQQQPNTPKPAKPGEQQSFLSAAAAQQFSQPGGSRGKTLLGQ